MYQLCNRLPNLTPLFNIVLSNLLGHDAHGLHTIAFCIVFCFLVIKNVTRLERTRVKMIFVSYCHEEIIVTTPTIHIQTKLALIHDKDGNFLIAISLYRLAWLWENTIYIHTHPIIHFPPSTFCHKITPPYQPIHQPISKTYTTYLFPNT